jgi:uncharacterized protein with HEPN domain
VTSADPGDPSQATTAEPDSRAVADLVEFCDAASRLVARGRAAYDSDEALRFAGEALIHRVGEAASRLSTGYLGQHPEVPWRAIRGMRNLIAHDYGRIDYVVLWNTMQNELPKLAASLGFGRQT